MNFTKEADDVLPRDWTWYTALYMKVFLEGFSYLSTKFSEEAVNWPLKELNPGFMTSGNKTFYLVSYSGLKDIFEKDKVKRVREREWSVRAHLVIIK